MIQVENKHQCRKSLFSVNLFGMQVSLFPFSGCFFFFPLLFLFLLVFLLLPLPSTVEELGL